MKKKVRLSQCMIVKNEGKNIERALTWAKGLVEEQIIVDTGSDDDTVAIAERLGAKVLHYPWNSDFSAAKNFALEQAAGNWIAFLDADEYFTPEDGRKLLNLLNKIEDTYNTNNKPHAIRCTGVNLDGQGRPFSTCVLDRIFRNIPSLRYHNRVHEELALPKGRDMLWYDARDQLSILHTGYTEDAIGDKARRNIAILETELEEKPEECSLLFYLGDSLVSAGELERACQVFEKLVGMTAPNAESGIYIEMACSQLLRLMAHLNVEDIQKALTAYEKGVRIAPDNPDIEYWFGCYNTLRGRWDESLRHLTGALEKLENYRGERVLYLPGELGKAYRLMAQANRGMGDLAAEVRNLVLSLRADRYQDAVLAELLRILGQEESGDLLGVLSFLEQLYHLEDEGDRLFIMKCAKYCGLEKLERILAGRYGSGQ